MSDVQLQQFVKNGFVKVENAFPRTLADEARAALWSGLRAQGCMPEDPTTWTRPVIRLQAYEQRPVSAAANTPRLHAAFDQLVGPGVWSLCLGMGALPIRFPSPDDPGDIGWHVDASFDYDKPDFLDWRANVHSRGRTLLMLFLFSDVGETDAPTRIRVGSHRHIARALAPAGEAGLTLRELIPHFSHTSHCGEALATGEAGTVYLCHPFLVHSAQMHRGAEPRFLAQPPLLPRREPWMAEAGAANAPVARAVRLALDERD